MGFDASWPQEHGDWILSLHVNDLINAVNDRASAVGLATLSTVSIGDWIEYAALDGIWDKILAVFAAASPDGGNPYWCPDDGGTIGDLSFEDFCNGVNGDSSGTDFYTYAPVDADWIDHYTVNAMMLCLRAMRYLQQAPLADTPNAGDNYEAKRTGNSAPASSDVNAEWAAASAAWAADGYAADAPWVVAGCWNYINRAAGPVYYAGITTYRTPNVVIELPADFPVTSVRKVRWQRVWRNDAASGKTMYVALYDEADYGGDVVASTAVTAGAGENSSDTEVVETDPDSYGSGGDSLEFSMLCFPDGGSPGDEIYPDDYRPATPTSNATWAVNLWAELPLLPPYYTPDPAFGFVLEPSWSYV